MHTHNSQNHLTKDKRSFGKKPNKKVIEDLLKYVTGGNVLDLGVGEGQNALFLGTKGFKVLGVDFDESAIRNLNSYADKLDLKEKVRGVVGDITKYQIKDSYDVVISTSTLHLIKKIQINALVSKIKEHTKPGGFNVITVFTEDNPLKDFPYLFKRGELKNFYLDWKIMEYEEYSTGGSHRHERWLDDTSKSHYHAIAAIIVQKPSFKLA